MAADVNKKYVKTIVEVQYVFKVTVFINQI